MRANYAVETATTKVQVTTYGSHVNISLKRRKILLVPVIVTIVNILLLLVMK